jgi:hypothetical protein
MLSDGLAHSGAAVGCTRASLKSLISLPRLNLRVLTRLQVAEQRVLSVSVRREAVARLGVACAQACVNHAPRN